MSSDEINITQSDSKSLLQATCLCIIFYNLLQPTTTVAATSTSPTFHLFSRPIFFSKSAYPVGLTGPLSSWHYKLTFATTK